jgi:hypothetical protein
MSRASASVIPLTLRLARIECSMPLPRRLPESRQTHYDHVMHTIEAVVHDMAPSYPAPPPFAPAQSSTSDSARGAAARPRAHTQPSQTMPEGPSGSFR